MYKWRQNWPNQNVGGWKVNNLILWMNVNYCSMVSLDDSLPDVFSSLFASHQFLFSENTCLLLIAEHKRSLWRWSTVRETPLSHSESTKLESEISEFWLWKPCVTMSHFCNSPLRFTLQLSMGIMIQMMKSCWLTLMKYVVFPTYFKL